MFLSAKLGKIYQAVHNYAHKHGLRFGGMKGSVGRDEAIAKALRMHTAGHPPGVIADYTGLTRGEVVVLIESLPNEGG